MNKLNDRPPKGGESRRSSASKKGGRTSSKNSSTGKENATNINDSKKKKDFPKENERKTTFKVESIWDSGDRTKETQKNIKTKESVDKKKDEKNRKNRSSSISDKSRETSKSLPKTGLTDPKNMSKNKQKDPKRNSSTGDRAKEKKTNSLKKEDIKKRDRSTPSTSENRTYSIKSAKHKEVNNKLTTHIEQRPKQSLQERKKTKKKIDPTYHNSKGIKNHMEKGGKEYGNEAKDKWEKHERKPENDKKYAYGNFLKSQTTSFSEVFYNGNKNETNMESNYRELPISQSSSKFSGLNSQYFGKEDNQKTKVHRPSIEMSEKEMMKAEKRKNKKNAYAAANQDFVNNDGNANMTDDEELCKKKKSIIYRFKQQQLKSWQHYWTPLCLIITYFIISLIFIIIGIAFIICSFSRKECKVSYENVDSSSFTLEINESTCTGPSRPFQRDTYVYYELHSFFQNHKSYLTSKSHSQLMGNIYTKEQEVFLCKPRILNSEGKILHPCGLIAYSIFNDTFTLYKDKDLKELIEIDDSKEAITWLNDYNKYKNPSGTEMEKYKSKVDFWLLSDHYKKILNMNDKTGYGVENSHFVVWMKTASLANFRKKYGKVNGNDELQLPIYVNIKNNFPVQNFDGKKFFVLAESSLFINEKNKSVGIIYLVLGSISLFVTISLLVNQWKHPRILGQI